MKRSSDTSERIKALREASHEDQGEFAASLGQARSLVSACESGAKTPSVETYVRLGSLASSRGMPAEAMWFWNRAGIETGRMLAVTSHVTNQRLRIPRPNEVIEIAPLPEVARQVGAPLLFSAQLGWNPRSTSFLLIDRNTHSYGYDDGDVIVVDTSFNNLASVSDGATALIEYSPERGGPVSWIIGKLDIHQHMLDARRWVTEVVPVADARAKIFGMPTIASFVTKVSKRRDVEDPEARTNEARTQMQMDPRYRIRGRVLAWLSKARGATDRVKPGPDFGFSKGPDPEAIRNLGLALQPGPAAKIPQKHSRTKTRRKK